MNAALRALDRGGRTVATVILYYAAGIPFSLAFLPFWLRDDPLDPLTLVAFLILFGLYIPWLGFIFPRILRFCWQREQVWPGGPTLNSPLQVSDGEQ